MSRVEASSAFDGRVCDNGEGGRRWRLGAAARMLRVAATAAKMLSPLPLASLEILGIDRAEQAKSKTLQLFS